jgi:hypothetical protein
MIPEFREILGLDNLDWYFPVKVADFDGECLSFFVRAIDDVEELFKKIQDKVENCNAMEDCYTHVSMEEDGRISVFLDTAYADDPEMSVHTLLKTLAEIPGIQSVIINEY